MQMLMQTAALILIVSRFVTGQDCPPDDPVCRQIGQKVCEPPLDTFGKAQCGVFCEFCFYNETSTLPAGNTTEVTTLPTLQTSNPTEICGEDDPICREVGSAICGPEYFDFAKRRCGVYCEYCFTSGIDNSTTSLLSSTTNTMPTTNTTTSLLSTTTNTMPTTNTTTSLLSTTTNAMPTTNTTTSLLSTTTNAMPTTNTTTSLLSTTTNTMPTTITTTSLLSTTTNTMPTTTTEEVTITTTSQQSTTTASETPQTETTAKPSPKLTTILIPSTDALSSEAPTVQPSRSPTTVQSTTVVQTTTQVQTSSPTPGHWLFEDCNNTAEIVFVLDSSSSVGEDNFKQMLEFTQNMTIQLKTEYRQLNITVITFSNEAKVAVRLNETIDLTSVLTAEGNISYSHGGTQTHKAIELMFKSFSHNVKNPKIAIVITDGASFEPDLTRKSSQYAKDNGVAIFVIGVGDDVNTHETKDISSDPDARFLHQLNNFAGLSTIVQLFHPRNCGVSTTKQTTVTTEIKEVSQTATATTSEPITETGYTEKPVTAQTVTEAPNTDKTVTEGPQTVSSATEGQLTTESPPKPVSGKLPTPIPVAGSSKTPSAIPPFQTPLIVSPGTKAPGTVSEQTPEPVETGPTEGPVSGETPVVVPTETRTTGPTEKPVSVTPATKPVQTDQTNNPITITDAPITLKPQSSLPTEFPVTVTEPPKQTESGNISTITEVDITRSPTSSITATSLLPETQKVSSVSVAQPFTVTTEKQETPQVQITQETTTQTLSTKQELQPTTITKSQTSPEPQAKITTEAQTNPQPQLTTTYEKQSTPEPQQTTITENRTSPELQQTITSPEETTPEPQSTTTPSKTNTTERQITPGAEMTTKQELQTTATTNKPPSRGPQLTTTSETQTTSELQPTTTSEIQTLQPQETTTTERRSTSQPQSTKATEKQTTQEPQPTTTTEKQSTPEPKPTTTTGKLITPEPQPTSTTVMQSTPEPQGTTTTEKQTTSEPQSTTTTEKLPTPEPQPTTTTEKLSTPEPYSPTFAVKQSTQEPLSTSTIVQQPTPEPQGTTTTEKQTSPEPQATEITLKQSTPEPQPTTTTEKLSTPEQQPTTTIEKRSSLKPYSPTFTVKQPTQEPQPTSTLVKQPTPEPQGTTTTEKQTSPEPQATDITLKQSTPVSQPTTTTVNLTTPELQVTTTTVKQSTPLSQTTSATKNESTTQPKTTTEKEATNEPISETTTQQKPISTQKETSPIPEPATSTEKQITPQSQPLSTEEQTLSRSIEISTAASVTSTQPMSTTTASCIAKVADIVFVVDSSGSIGLENFQKVKQFIKDVIMTFDVGLNRTRVALIEYSTLAHIEFKLNEKTNQADLLKAVDNVTYSGGGTSTSDALKLMRTEGFDRERPDAPDIVVVITDGLSKYPSITRVQANLAKSEGITMFSIGIGNLTDKDELLAIASDKRYLFEVGDFETLLTIDSVVAHLACGVILPEQHYTRISTSPATTPSGCVDLSPDCASYPRDSCTDYEPYARKNCARTCGYCPGFPLVEPECKDDVENCEQYGTSMCYNPAQYDWVDSHCRKFCGFCGNKTELYVTTNPPTTQVMTTVSSCTDNLECSSYNADLCTNPTYASWARQNCRKYCGFCYIYYHVTSAYVNQIQCPSWDLPEQCTLEYRAGQCCPFPKCPEGLRLTIKRHLS